VRGRREGAPWLSAWYHRGVKDKPLEPLIPLEDLKKVVAGLIAVPKPEKPEPKKPDRAP
jgi:hypothetical protein